MTSSEVRLSLEELSARIQSNIKQQNQETKEDDLAYSKTKDSPFMQPFPNCHISILEKEHDYNPVIPDKVYNQLPTILGNACENYQIGRERDVFLLSSITAISGCLKSIYVNHDKHKVYPNICTVIIAPPASKKSTLKDARPLTSKIIFEKVSDFEGVQNQSLEYYEPSVWVGADSSAAALNGIINANDSRGVLWSTELKTLINSLKQDFGNYTSSLLKAFHNEPIEVNRRGSNGRPEQLNINTPKFSILFSGVPNDVQWLFGSRDSGLTSRFLIYSFNEISTWEDLFGVEDSEDFLEESSVALESMISISNSETNRFEFTNSQRDRHKIVFSKLLEENPEYSDAVKRYGLAVAKIAMVLSVVRGVKSQSGVIECHEEDFISSMTLVVEVLWPHFKYNADLFCQSTLYRG